MVDPRLTLASSVARRAGELLRQAYSGSQLVLAEQGRDIKLSLERAVIACCRGKPAP